ncbi:MAG: hypothetical protein PHW00_03295 [Clostridia bacterium]|nr:hypothetical protein [Clostridia bacterium]
MNSIMSACTQSLSLCLSLCCVYCFWLGMFNILTQCGAVEWLSRILNPIVNKLYGNVNKEAQQYICLNLSANLLGVSNASTPSAVKAVNHIYKGETHLTRPTAMLLVINATGMQLIPTTVISLRASAGSINASDIILPTLIVTTISTAVGIIATSICYKKDN